MLLAFVIVNGCGQEIKTVYVQAPIDQSGSKLTITGKNTQNVQLFSNKDGSIRFLDNGSIPVFPEDVEKVVCSGYRMGVDYSSPISGNIDSSGLVRFSSVPNNGDEHYKLILKDHKIEPIGILIDKKVDTYKPMKYWVSDNGWITYGNQVETSGSSRIEGENIVLDFYFGCDMLPGLIQNASFIQGMTIEFVTAGGRSFSVLIQSDEITGNLSAVGMIIPMTVLSDSQWGQRNVNGKFYIVSPNGDRYVMNFNYRREDIYVWYLPSYTDQFYMSYVYGTDEVQFQYYLQ